MIKRILGYIIIWQCFTLIVFAWELGKENDIKYYQAAVFTLIIIVFLRLCIFGIDLMFGDYD